MAHEVPSQPPQLDQQARKRFASHHPELISFPESGSLYLQYINSHIDIPEHNGILYNGI